MDNLKIHNVKHFPFSQENKILKGIECDTYVCFLTECAESTPDLQLYSIKQMFFGKSEVITINLDIGSNNIVSDLEYLPFINTVCLSTSTRLFATDFTSKSVTVIDFPLQDNDSVIATSWNSEHDALAVAYNSGRVKTFCINFATSALTLLGEDHIDNKGHENVYLGWGDVKKQFKGKAIATYLKESHPPESDYEHILENGSVSWKFGEQLFAVNATFGNKRVIRVFDLECKLFYSITNSKVPGMCSKTVFRPKHNTLATICQGNNGKSYVVLHECNGEYYDTIFPFSKEEIDDLYFSPCGRIFAILSHAKDTYFLDLYTSSNFKWMQKYRFCGSKDKLLSFKLMPSINTIHLVQATFTSDNGITIYELANTLTTTLKNSTAYVQVANTLQIFDYNKEIIPPRGENISFISTDEPINAIIVDECNDNLLVLIDALQIAHIFIRSDGAWISDHEIDLKFFKFRDILINWFRYEIVVNNKIECLKVTGFANNMDDIKVQGSGNILYVEGLIRLDDDRSPLQDFRMPIQVIPGSRLIDQMDSISIRSLCTFDMSDGEIHCIWSYNAELFMQGNVIMNRVTSIIKYKFYLLITATGFDDPMDYLHCIDMHNYKAEVENISEISWSRKIEKGSTLVTMASDEAGVVLQMPRGNIELISVRPVILRSLYKKVVDGMFLEAYHLTRRHAMKPDVLYDLAPHMFRENVGLFVQSLESTESIIKFLLALQDKSTLSHIDYMFVEKFSVADKLKGICDDIINIYSDKECREDDASHCKIICMALFVKHNRDAYEALRFLVRHNQGKYTPATLQQLADVISTMKIYCNANQLYNQALILYDVELVATIAQVTGMDPQVYRKFLKECYQADQCTRRYLMANESGNFKLAGLYMLILYRNKQRTMDEFLEYISDKDVLDDVYTAMNLTDGSALLKVSQLLNQRYTSLGMYEKAVNVLCKAGEQRKSIELLISGARCKEAIQLIISSALDNQTKNIYFEQLANACKAHGNYKGAASIYLSKCFDVDKAINCYLSGQCFLEAVNLLENPKLTCHVDNALYRAKLKDLLIQKLKNLEASYESYNQMFLLHFARLKQVREERKHRAECTTVDDDAYSEAGSVTTRTHTSHASSTTRRTRKLQLKLQSLRHGGKFEDIALIRELYTIVNAAFDLAKDLNEIEGIFMQYAEINSSELRSSVAHFTQLIRNAANNIWYPEYINLEDDVLMSDFLTENIVYLEKKYRVMPDILEY